MIAERKQLYNLSAHNRTTHRDRRRADPTTGFLPSYHTRYGIVWQCFSCGKRCDGPKLYCDEHLAAVALRP